MQCLLAFSEFPAEHVIINDLNVLGHPMSSWLIIGITIQAISRFYNACGLDVAY